MAGVLAVVALAAGCGGDDEPWIRQGNFPATPSPLPTAIEELRASFEEFSGLTVPSDATDVEITADHNGANLPLYRAQFTTSRGGAEVFCTDENFDVYVNPDPPDAETRERLGITEETVDGMVTCRGTNLDRPNVRREVVVVWPEKDTAAVHALIQELPG
ncbi:hypothetical protein HDA32_004837 [Spinactinospora alkalitolerans]|uniref:Uncharacterized protein n=1 Tax=Spinactinospora alkalitolerans TaxID=687207 RepID=A0A852U293_9ACTN|nr:hypothetical protein [Spinactinospora alkalitolerans]NYE49717.1 hypothetical protein [Spinactinospora alkalitolerans]